MATTTGRLKNKGERYEYVGPNHGVDNIESVPRQLRALWADRLPKVDITGECGVVLYPRAAAYHLSRRGSRLLPNQIASVIVYSRARGGVMKVSLPGAAIMAPGREEQAVSLWAPGTGYDALIPRRLPVDSHQHGDRLYAQNCEPHAPRNVEHSSPPLAKNAVHTTHSGELDAPAPLPEDRRDHHRAHESYRCAQ